MDCLSYLLQAISLYLVPFDCPAVFLPLHGSSQFRFTNWKGSCHHSPGTQGAAAEPAVGSSLQREVLSFRLPWVALAISCALLTVGALCIQFSFSIRQKGLHGYELNLKAVP